MELDRSGTYRFHGWTELFNRAPKRSWNAEDGKVTLDVNRVSDGANTFNYRISLTLEEIAQLVDLVATSATANSRDQVAHAFSDSLRSLTRLAGVASGLAVIDPPDASARKGAA